MELKKNRVRVLEEEGPRSQNRLAVKVKEGHKVRRCLVFGLGSSE